jgi:hypothetical protein
MPDEDANGSESEGNEDGGSVPLTRHRAALHIGRYLCAVDDRSAAGATAESFFENSLFRFG